MVFIFLVQFWRYETFPLPDSLDSPTFFCYNELSIIFRRKVVVRVENIHVPVTTQLKNDIETCLQELNLSWEEFLQGSLENILRNKEIEQAVSELREMERSGDYGKGYTDVDLMMKELLE